ncbi:hypothetical protein Bca4012_016204 [Brassica carinata]
MMPMKSESMIEAEEPEMFKAEDGRTWLENQGKVQRIKESKANEAEGTIGDGSRTRGLEAQEAYMNKIGYGEKAKKLVMMEMLKTWMMVDSRHGCARRF